MGWYSLCPNRELILRWDRWPVDYLRWNGTSYRNDYLSLTPANGNLSVHFDTAK